MMGPGRPSKYSNRHHLGVVGEKADHDRFMKICQREGISPADKINEWIKQYNRIHGDGNPQYTITQFVENSDFKAVPALLSPTEKWREFLASAELEEVLQITQQVEILRRMGKVAINEKVKAVHRTIRAKAVEKKEVESRKALPKESDPGALRRSHLRELWRLLTLPSHSKKGKPYDANVIRRQTVIRHILATQELLPEYQRCQEYDEWLEGLK